MSRVVTQKASGYAGASFPNEGSLLLRRMGQAAGDGPGIVALHGRTGDCLQYAPYANKLSIGYFADLLAREGFRVLAIDDMGGTDWGSQDSTARINDAVTYLQGAGGAKAGKVGIMGWSMGGIAALNWIDQNVAKHACSWLWCPCSDLEWARAQPAWTAEVDAAYAAEGTRAGNSPVASPANYRGAGRIHLRHAQDDATIPVQQSRDFVAAVNDPLVTLAEAPNGGHSNLFAAVTDLELVSYYRTHLGVPG